LLDIETAPSLGWVWRKYQQDVIEFQQNWYMLSFAYKWLGETTVSVRALPDYKGYRPGLEDDKPLIKDLWALLEEADIVVGHNVDYFDIRKANARSPSIGSLLQLPTEL
jgi:DNA polymerase elongation subunit (family B)